MRQRQVAGNQTTSDRRNTATHEAGQTVVGHVPGLLFSEAVIKAG